MKTKITNFCTDRESRVEFLLDFPLTGFTFIENPKEEIFVFRLLVVIATCFFAISAVAGEKYHRDNIYFESGQVVGNAEINAEEFYTALSTEPVFKIDDARRLSGPSKVGVFVGAEPYGSIPKKVTELVLDPSTGLYASNLFSDVMFLSKEPRDGFVEAILDQKGIVVQAKIRSIDQYVVAVVNGYGHFKFHEKYYGPKDPFKPFLGNPFGGIEFLRNHSAKNYRATISNLQDALKRDHVEDYYVHIDGLRYNSTFFLVVGDDSDMNDKTEAALDSMQEKLAEKEKIENLRTALNTYITNDCNRLSILMKGRLTGIGAFSSFSVVNNACWMENPFMELGVEIGWIDATGCDASDRPENCQITARYACGYINKLSPNSSFDPICGILTATPFPVNISLAWKDSRPVVTAWREYD
ncbi:hypothetical protein [Maritalea porphyrae]|uniref:hypothetical protein n=1 Tax=Maritalea porphyrae TaxID=880732 RepID=UPI0022AED7CB|nr:hypothetical protein [Maritalea porphyrae]MCZ4274211.1 hypothetical protein [Maritalea porphyrae]